MPQPHTLEAIKAYIDRNSKQDGPHLIYSGRPRMYFDSKQMSAARIYWRLSGRAQPDNTWLLKRCSEHNCIDPDCWELSLAPAVFVPYKPGAPPAVAAGPSGAVLRALKALRASHEAQGAALTALSEALGLEQ